MTSFFRKMLPPKRMPFLGARQPLLRLGLLSRGGRGWSPGARRVDNVLYMEAVTDLPVQAISPEHLPAVALVGRPNVGKSTLFNRLSRQRKAVVDHTPGVTRDRNFARVQWRDRSFLLVDTGGIDLGEKEGLVGRVQEQTRLAITEADLVIFLFDGREGINPADAQAVDLLRRSDTPVFFAVNKIDGDKQALASNEFYALGLNSLFSISAAHGRGISELLDTVVEALAEQEAPSSPTVLDAPSPAAEPDLRLAIIGRPNVGKSSLLNRLAGVERSIVDSTPGTTRDAVDSWLTWQDKRILLVDTAGVRRRTRISEHIEQASALIALKALERAEIGLLVFDAQEGMTDQDARLARYAWAHGRGIVLVVNKWDLIPSDRKNQPQFIRALHEEFPVTQPLPIVFLSALTGSRLKHLLPTAHRVAQAHRTEISTPVLNQAFDEWTTRHPAPIYHRKPVRFYYATQVETKPPKIAVYTSSPDGIPAHYERYLENQIRDAFALKGTPVRLDFRARRPQRYGKKKR